MDDDFEQVQNEIMINDIRTSSQFRTISFSGYKKTEVNER